MPHFEFSIRTALKRSWSMFTNHPWFFIALTLVVLLLNISSRGRGGERSILLMVVILLASLIWSYVLLSVSLSAVDGKDELLKFGTISYHVPTLRQLAVLIGIAIVSGLIIGVGFILFIIPGIYFLIRLSFSNLAFVDRQGSVMQSLRYSWHLIHGDIFWTVFLTLMVSVIMVIVGILLLGVGFLVAYPIAFLTIAQLYRALTIRQSSMQEIVEQPIEIPAHTEESPIIPTPETI